jgi:hypothetical protein
MNYQVKYLDKIGLALGVEYRITKSKFVVWAVDKVSKTARIGV